MAIELDFVKQLTSTTTIVKNEESYINKKEQGTGSISVASSFLETI